MKKDIVERLREASGYALMDAARVTVLEAADEIERMRSLLRFQDGVIRSGDTACLTYAESEAVKEAVEDFGDRDSIIYRQMSENLRGLLERLK